MLVILDLPFLLRLLQCLRRYVDGNRDRAPVELLNALKYTVPLYRQLTKFNIVFFCEHFIREQ